MNQLSTEERTVIVKALVEGNSLRATSRMTGASKNTIVKLLADIGSACAAYQDRAFRNLSCRRIQVDEIWSFCYSKEKNIPEEKRGQFGFGDVWTFTAIDAETKLVPCWLVGLRDAGSAFEFVNDLASRMDSRIQLTTDGLKVYLEAVEDAFGGQIDYAMLQKIYGKDRGEDSATRYSPPAVIGTRRETIQGAPESKHVSTSFVERQNLTMRMSMRRFTRLTNGFSKKIENLAHAVALHFAYYNLVRPHQTLRVTPAMAAGLEEDFWEIQDLVALIDQKKAK